MYHTDAGQPACGFVADLGVAMNEDRSGSSSLMEMEWKVWLHWSIWVMLSEEVFLLVWIQHSYAKYKEYRAEAMI